MMHLWRGIIQRTYTVLNSNCGLCMQAKFVVDFLGQIKERRLSCFILVLAISSFDTDILAHPLRFFHQLL